jgi:hypothetical protein
MSEHQVRYTDGTTYLILRVPWGLGTGWIPPGHIDFAMTVTHETRRFVYDGEVDDARLGPKVGDA